MIQKWPLMHASRLVKPLKETQTEVLVAKERDNTQGSDLGFNSARVPQEVLPHMGHFVSQFILKDEVGRLKGSYSASTQTPKPRSYQIGKECD
jgi:hypothetical protein